MRDLQIKERCSLMMPEPCHRRGADCPLAASLQLGSYCVDATVSDV